MQRSPSTADLVSEAQIHFTDFLILEHYLHQIVKLRLTHSDRDSLFHASEYATIVTKLLKLLDKRFNSNPPFDKNVNGRKLLAKFIGLALYKAGRECVMTRGPECSIEGPCCLRHRAEGIREAHDIFNDLLRAVDEYIAGNSAFNTTIQAIQIELKTRVVLDHLSYSASTEHNLPELLDNLISKYFNGNAYATEKLNSRAAALRDIVQNNLAPALPTILETKFPFSLFESNLRNFLKSIDALFPEVLLSGFIAGHVDNKEKLQRSASDILSISRPASKLASPVRDIPVVHEPSLLQTPTKKIYPNTPAAAAEEEEPKPLSPIRIVFPQTNKRHRSVLSPPRKPVANIAAPEVADERNPFAGAKISGKFFRGVLEPSDERFASIADGTDPQCKQFIIDRARKAASIFVRTVPPKPVPKAAPKLPSKTELAAKSTSMLDRHDSAERIAWESQMSPAPSAPKIISQVLQEKTFEQIQLITNSDPDAIQRVRLPSRARRRFTDEETSNLIEGYKRFGADWKSILKHYKFDNRTNVDLKDKARNLLKHGLL